MFDILKDIRTFVNRNDPDWKNKMAESLKGVRARDHWPERKLEMNEGTKPAKEGTGLNEDIRPVKIHIGPNREDISDAMCSTLREENEWLEQFIKRIQKELEMFRNHSVQLDAALRNLVFSVKDFTETSLDVLNISELKSEQSGLDCRAEESMDILQEIFTEQEEYKKKCEEVYKQKMNEIVSGEDNETKS